MEKRKTVELFPSFPGLKREIWVTRGRVYGCLVKNRSRSFAPLSPRTISFVEPLAAPLRMAQL